MLLTARNLSKSFGSRHLFTGITLGLAESERVGLIGANGSGKSTLLRIFAGLETPDEGELIAKRGLRVGYVAQQDAFPDQVTCVDFVAGEIEPGLDLHERRLRATILLDQAGFADPAAPAVQLSGGWRKRLALLAQLAKQPDLLLLDEPTNHLDLDGILWLEKRLADSRMGILMVSHDRRMLETVSTRIIELSAAYPEGFLSNQGSYSDFLEKREDFLQTQQSRQQSLAGSVRREIAWLRRGAKARTTKAKGRIQRAEAMQNELADLRTRNAAGATARIDFSASGRKTRKLLQLKGVAKTLGGNRLFHEVDLTLRPGTKLGLIGPNGSGKSTLIRIMAGQLAPDAGEIVRADGLRVVVFDQHREQLDPTQTLRRALSPMGENVEFRGASVHVVSWARRFQFKAEQLDLPVGELSGGEQARVLIARLMLRQADLLILDEPTNDLDIPTLDVLESSLESFDGALVLVTHDRYLLERLSSELLALDADGGAHPYADLDQWQRARDARDKPPAKPVSDSSDTPKAAPSSSDRKRLTWHEKKEWETMERTILEAEAALEEAKRTAADPAIAADHVRLNEAYQAMGEAQQAVDRLYARWAELEAKQA